MGERGLFTTHIVSSTNTCKFEGVDKRPKDCPNNPLKNPENHRPNVCADCPNNREIFKVAQQELPSIHIAGKQEMFAKKPI